MMVAISFSIPGLIFKILTREKQTTIREFNKKWQQAYDKFKANPDIEIPLSFYHKQRSQHGFRFILTHIENLELYDISKMTEQDAYLDGGSKKMLLDYFEKEYGPNSLEKKFIRVWWPSDFDKGIVKPNKTKIDWFDKKNQELYTINPLVIHKPKKAFKNCFYNCLYCYARTFYIMWAKNYSECFYESRLRGLKYAKENVFISSTTDLFHEKIPDDILRHIIEKSNLYNENNCNLYFLTKNPGKYQELLEYFDPKTNWLGMTLETDSYDYQNIENISLAPEPRERVKAFREIDYPKKFLSLEPILEFSDNLIVDIISCNPKFVFIGANSNRKYQKLFVEPSSDDIAFLIKKLKRNDIDVIEKKNLSRLYKK